MVELNSTRVRFTILTASVTSFITIEAITLVIITTMDLIATTAIT